MSNVRLSVGGLRIGKVHDEDHPDGDGQYFHYITKVRLLLRISYESFLLAKSRQWAFALSCMSLARNDRKYNELAVQLLKVPSLSFLPRSLLSYISNVGCSSAVRLLDEFHATPDVLEDVH